MKIKQGLVITGTDTDIGKTWISGLLMLALMDAGKPAGYFKPVQTGQDSDTHAVGVMAGLDSGPFLPDPVFHLDLAASPDRAAAAQGVTIGLGAIENAWNELKTAHWVVEGAGGLMVPLNTGQTYLDLFAALKLPVLVVASTRLGTINHTLLTLKMLAMNDIPTAGYVLNGVPDPGLEDTIGAFTKVPLIAKVPKLDPVHPEAMLDLARQAFPPDTLKVLFPAEVY